MPKICLGKIIIFFLDRGLLKLQEKLEDRKFIFVITSIFLLITGENSSWSKNITRNIIPLNYQLLNANFLALQLKSHIEK